MTINCGGVRVHIYQPARETQSGQKEFQNYFQKLKIWTKMKSTELNLTKLPT